MYTAMHLQYVRSFQQERTNKLSRACWINVGHVVCHWISKLQLLENAGDNLLDYWHDKPPAAAASLHMLAYRHMPDLMCGCYARKAVPETRTTLDKLMAHGGASGMPFASA